MQRAILRIINGRVVGPPAFISPDCVCSLLCGDIDYRVFYWREGDEEVDYGMKAEDFLKIDPVSLFK